MKFSKRSGPLEVINVTADVYSPEVVRQHLAEERKHRLYRPFILKRQIKVRGRIKIAYCVCRLPVGPKDRVFVSEVRRSEVKRRHLHSFVTVAKPDQLLEA